MKNKTLSTMIALVATAAISALFISCDNDENIISNATSDNPQTSLSFDVTINETPSSRATLITKWTDAIAAKGLGVTLYNGTTASSGMYPLCTGTAVYTTTDNRWQSTTPLRLNKQSAFITAYYPVSIFSSQVNASPTNLRVTNLDYDLLYSPLGRQMANSDNPHVVMPMYHAFACMKLSVKRLDYTGRGQLQKIVCQSPGIGVSGIFDSTTGTFSNVITGTVSKNLTGTYLAELQMNSYNTFVIAKESAIQPIYFTVNIDGKQYTCTINQRLRQGYINEFVMTFSDKGIEVTEVTSSLWKTTETNSSSAVISDWTPE